MPDRGEIWLADLNPPHGTEPRRPVPFLLVDDAEPLRLRIPAAGKLPRHSDLLMDQMRAIDNRRLVRGPLDRLPPAAMKRVVTALFEILG